MPLSFLDRAAVGFARTPVLMAVFAGLLRFAVSLIGCVAGSASLLALSRLRRDSGVVAHTRGRACLGIEGPPIGNHAWWCAWWCTTGDAQP
jgi:hypothetical protein